MDAAENLFAVQWSGFCNPALNTLFIANRQVIVGNVGTYWNRDADLFMFMQPVKRRWAITPRWKSNVDGTTEDLLQAAAAGDNVACAFQRSAGSEDWQEWFDQRWNPTTPNLLKLREECPKVPSTTVSSETQASALPPRMAGDVTPGLVPVRPASSIDKPHCKVSSVGQGQARCSGSGSPYASRNHSHQQVVQEDSSAIAKKPTSANSDNVNKSSWTEWECTCGYRNYMRNTICGGSGRSGCGRPRPSHLNKNDQEAGRRHNSWNSQSAWASKDTRAWKSEERWNYTGHTQGRQGWWPPSSESNRWHTHVEKTDEGDKKDHKDKTHKKDKKAKKEKTKKMKQKKEKKSKKEKTKKKDEASSSDSDRSERGEESVQQPPSRLTNDTVTDASKSVSSKASAVPHAPSSQLRKSLALAALAGSLCGSYDNGSAEPSPTRNATPTPAAGKQEEAKIAEKPEQFNEEERILEEKKQCEEKHCEEERASEERKQRQEDRERKAIVECTISRKRKPWPVHMHSEDCGCTELENKASCDPPAKVNKGTMPGTSAVAHASSQRSGNNAPPVPRWRL